MEGGLAAAGASGGWEGYLHPAEAQPMEQQFSSYPGMQTGMGACQGPCMMCDMPADMMNVTGRRHSPFDMEGGCNWTGQHPQQRIDHGEAGLSHGLSLHLRDGLRKARDAGIVPFMSDTSEFVDQMRVMPRDLPMDGDCVLFPHQYGMMGEGSSEPWTTQELGMDFRHDECANDLCELPRVAAEKHHLAQSSMSAQFQHAPLSEPFMCTKPRFDQTLQPPANQHSSLHQQPDIPRNVQMSNFCETELSCNEMNRMTNLSEINHHRDNISFDLDMYDHSACDPLDSVLERLKEESHYRNDTSMLLGEPEDWYSRMTVKDTHHRPPVRPLCLPEVKNEDWPEDCPLGVQGGLYQFEPKPGPTKAPNNKVAFSEGESSSDQSCVTIKHEPRDSPKTPNSTCPVLQDITQKSRLKTSEYTGVSKHKKSGRWEVHIWLSDLGRQVYLGGYDDVVAAAEAYDIVQLRSRGLDAKTNFPIAKYKKRLETVMSLSLEELISDVRRSSKGFSRGVSNFRGVTKNPNGRWEARIGAYGSRHVYLGLYSHEKEAAIHYDRALVRLRGQKSATNFPLGNYKDALEQHMRISQELGNISVVSLGRIPVVKPHFELFLKFGGRETDSLISAVKRLDGRGQSVLSKKNARQKIGCRPRCSRDCTRSNLHSNTSVSGGDES